MISNPLWKIIFLLIFIYWCFLANFIQVLRLFHWSSVTRAVISGLSLTITVISSGYMAFTDKNKNEENK
tara:strand:+ start:103 stop:309 length:207 start_codon:yes stop_codon:yes gene_type:complete